MEFERQWAMWLEQKEARREMGDRLAATRDVDHTWYFPFRGRAKAAEDELSWRGYRVRVSGAWFNVAVYATKPASLNDASVEEMLHEVLALAKEHGGRYDGFGAVGVI